MNYLPLFFDLRSRRALVVGGDESAARKIRLLDKVSADLIVVAPVANDEISGLAAAGRLTLHRRPFAAPDVLGCAAVFSATGDLAADREVAAAAQAANVPVNVTDRPELSTFIVPAIVDRDPIVIGISSGGTAPVLARTLRAQIESLLPARLGTLARFASGFRKAAQGLLPSSAARRQFWERFFASSVAETVLAGDDVAARSAMLPLLNRAAHDAAPGVVYLVGAGPGDADLLTFRALRLMQQADVVLYDELIGPEILDRVRRDAERVYVGKAKGRHSLSQDEINVRMLHEAQAGKRVLRLKGGDPFVFGRGGEEREYLRRHGIDVVSVPGITAGLGALAYAGIPLTHRDHASSVTFVTGHTRPGDPEIDWQALASADRTLVVYMGLSNAGEIADRLIAAGLESSTPVAIIQNGTRDDQTVSVGRLAELGALAATHAGAGPALLVIGGVVTLSEAWAQTFAPQKVASW
jgi:uroporphyrin-III C-methyltransferase/precorrin-2 dehydrogenase/sirohydrochlorin ferrochelatase